MKPMPGKTNVASGLYGWGARHRVVVALLVLAAVAVVSPAAAQEDFALLGVWQHTDQGGVQTIAFNPDGTFQSRWDIPPGANGAGSGVIQWRGVYRATGASAWVAKMLAFRFCASGGGCTSCPPSPDDLPSAPTYGAELAKYFLGFTVGEPVRTGWEMSGSNQATDPLNRTWRRVR
jgi:hypothetical protein